MASTIDSIQLITDNTPSVTDWLMFGITLIYVIATVAIWKANNKSAQATKEQLKESERQFSETQRLACMPFLQLEYDENPHRGEFYISLFPDVYNAESESFEVGEGNDYYFWLKNLGKGSATNLIYSWQYKDGKYESHMLPINGLMDRDKYPVAFYVDATKKIEGTLEWGFSDMLGGKYTQKVFMAFENGEITKLENDVPKYGG